MNTPSDGKYCTDPDHVPKTYLASAKFDPQKDSTTHGANKGLAAYWRDCLKKHANLKLAVADEKECVKLSSCLTTIVLAWLRLERWTEK